MTRATADCGANGVERESRSAGRATDGAGAAGADGGLDTRVTASSRHVILATFSGDDVLSGTQRALAVLVRRAPTAFLAGAAPASAAAGTPVALHAWHLPGLATGTVVFTSGAVRLCVAVVASGGAVCTADADLALGAHRVIARYVGDRDFGSSLARTTLSILPSAPDPTS